MSQHWMIMDETGGNYYSVEYSAGRYSCSCAHWQSKNDRFSYRLSPGPCKHINAVSGAKVSVRQRKYGHIVRLR
jgi:hypothetical protein